MWKIFSKKESDIGNLLFSIEQWKANIFSKLEKEVKEYFAKKIVMYFDNNMIFYQKRGLHINLMEALSTAEKEMLNCQGLFSRIEMYWVRDEDEHILIIFGLKDEDEESLLKEGFNLVKRDAMPLSKKMEELEKGSWKTLIFDAELVNYAKGWINYTPELEERSKLQTEHILLNMHLKKNASSLLEIIEFENKIKSHTSYEELYQKVLRIMPKIENSLEQEWRTGNVEVLHNSIKKKKV